MTISEQEIKGKGYRRKSRNKSFDLGEITKPTARQSQRCGGERILPVGL